MLVGLLVHVGVAVIAPALNGAARHANFCEHAVTRVTLSSLVTLGSVTSYG